MNARRALLLLIFAVSFDLGAVAIPTPHGVVWDDDEEVLHLRRSASSPRRVASLPASRSTVVTAKPDRRVPHPASGRPAVAATRPRADLSAESPPPTEDH